MTPWTVDETLAYRRRAVESHIGCHRWTIDHARWLREQGYRQHAARELAVAGEVHRAAAIRALAFVGAPIPGAPLTLF